MENNPIPLKTSDPDFNRHDFMQTECGAMEELTVTITLHEYRELVKENATRTETCYRYLNDLHKLKSELNDANSRCVDLDEALCVAHAKNEAMGTEIKTLHAEVGRQEKIIADLKTRLSNEIRHQTFVKEDPNAEG